MCSIFSRILDGQIIVGRNFDWIQFGGNLHFIPPAHLYGLQTYGMCLIEQFGVDRPLEGFNSQGLFIGMTGVHTDLFSPQQSNNTKIKLDEFGAIKFVLERASTTQNAIEILEHIDIISHGIEPYIRLQYFIVDCYGAFCAIAGQEKTDIKQLDANEFAILTNFPLSLKDRVICERFSTIERGISHVDSEQKAMYLVEAVSQEEFTVHSCLYFLNHKTISICVERNFQSVLKFHLDQEISQGSGFYNFGQLKLMSPQNRDRFKDVLYEIQSGFL